MKRVARKRGMGGREMSLWQSDYCCCWSLGRVVFEMWRIVRKEARRVTGSRRFERGCDCERAVRA